MKKYFSNIRTLAALLMAGAAFAACSNDDSGIVEQPVSPTALKTYTLTVNASKGGNTTRALELDETGSKSKVIAKWEDGDEVTVYKGDDVVGTLTASGVTDGSSATFTGTVTGDFTGISSLKLVYHPYTGLTHFASQDGTLNGTANSAENYDCAEATIAINPVGVDDTEITINGDGANFTTTTAVLKLTLQDDAAEHNPINAISLKISATITQNDVPIISDELVSFTPATTAYDATANGSGILYFAMPNADIVAERVAAKYSSSNTLQAILQSGSVTMKGLLQNASITFTASDGVNVYSVTKTGYAFAAGKYYSATLSMAKTAFDALSTPLTIEAKEDCTIKFSNTADGIVTYRINGAAQGTDIAAGGSSGDIAVNAGDKVEFSGKNGCYACFNSSLISCSGSCIVYGNIMSLINSDDFANATELTKDNTFQLMFYNNTNINIDPTKPFVLPATTLKTGCYNGMFWGCTSLTSAPALPATQLAGECYANMFSGCTSLTSAPALPATTLATGCYKYMFYGCTSLTSAPALPAETLENYCYWKMFSGCTSLTSASALPATQLATNCYDSMFSACTSLAVAPALPATTLAPDCYADMFSDCTSLTSAPALPAEELQGNCYKEMFSGCTKLTSVSCAATDISAEDCTTDWLAGVSTTGTFKKAVSIAVGEGGWSRDASGIPSGWEVEDLP